MTEEASTDEMDERWMIKRWMDDNERCMMNRKLIDGWMINTKNGGMDGLIKLMEGWM